jgi:hypothetical protein
MELDPDGIASNLLRRARLDLGEVLPLRAVASALGLTLVVVRSKSVCGAALPGLIVYDGTTRALAHELAHHACAYAGLPLPHDERFVAAVGACLTVPAVAFRRAHRRDSGTAGLALAFAVRETCVALRIGEVTGAPVAIVTPTRIYARGEWEWPAEDVLRRMLRANSSRITAKPLGADPRRMLVTPTPSYQS